ncbi:MAG: hypothetical protein AB7F23_10335 [Phycisphaerae bacterium]|jgi:hypothetical protein
MRYVLGVRYWTVEDREECSIHDSDFDFGTKGFSKTYDMDFNNIVYLCDGYILQWQTNEYVYNCHQVAQDPLKLRVELIQEGNVIQEHTSNGWSQKDLATGRKGMVKSVQSSELCNISLPAGNHFKPLQMKVTVVEPSNFLGTSEGGLELYFHPGWF